MKNEYVKPSLEIVSFNAENVMTTSGTGLTVESSYQTVFSSIEF